MSAAKLIGVGVGPGDPELLTLKAMRALGEADVIAHFAKAGNPSHSRAIVAEHLRADVAELPLLYPVTTELPTCSAGYRDAIRDFYDGAAAKIAAHLDAGRVVAVICEGDPLFYGSYMHLHTRLAPRFTAEIVAGVTGMSGCWSAAGMPIAQGDDVFTVLPATLPEAELDAPARRRRRRGGDEGRAASAQAAPRAGPERPAGARHLCRARHHGGGENDSAHRQARRRGALFRGRPGAGME